ncbi:Six-bladed beta-propeller TolB-like protein [Dioscorea alata]|uniref:Six-bladed beta-propeller TolB-like protein n=1 Tax=Dioscorea alata TaxID=55571 RepID=A0ACB7UBY1_DIOAL|nr:Six-bladed beta-propeller TolB-like protein [Dioscorea alata]
MEKSLLLLLLFSAAFLQFQADAYSHGVLAKHLSSVLKWTTRAASQKTTHSDGDHLEFESGYLVETVVEGNKLGIVPHAIRVSPEGELFIVDSDNSNIVRVTPPLSQYSRARLVAGSFQGYSGHVDGKPSDARFGHPRGVTMDDKGNVYVADTSNLAIRKIGEAGVTTIAGGKSNVAGYSDGPSEDAKFSNDFDVVYVKSTCSLLVVDRGNAALRQISLNQEDCDFQYTSISVSDIVMVIGAVVVGYASCLLQHGFGPSSSAKNQASESEALDISNAKKPTVVVESLKEDLDAGWPSLGRLFTDLLKFAMEAIGNLFLSFIPHRLKFGQSKGLTPLKDRLLMPEDEAETPLVQKQQSSPAVAETLHTPKVNTDSTLKPQKSGKPPKFKDPSLSSKHRSSKRQEFAEFYGSAESPQIGSKNQKDRVRHRHREKSGEVVFGAVANEPKPVEMRSADFGDAKFEHYNIRSKYGADSSYRF